MTERVSNQDIIDALLETSFMRSTGSTSLSDIASRLGIKKASLYNHFESRDAIIRGTMDYCAQCLSQITFVPSDLESVTEKYPPETVLKGIVNRWFKMHEKTPLFQIYTFVQSQKYYSQQASQICADGMSKIIDQTNMVVSLLWQKGKLNMNSDQLKDCSAWFCHSITNLMDLYLQKRKQVVMQNPDTGAGSLFSLPTDEENLKQVDHLVEQFVNFLR